MIFDYAGKKGIGLIITVRCDRLKKVVTKHYMHNDGMDTKSCLKAAS